MCPLSVCLYIVFNSLAVLHVIIMHVFCKLIRPA